MSHHPVKLECLDPATLNNDGVAWMLMGNSEEAIVSFKHALTAMKTSLVRIPQSAVSDPRSSTLYSSVDIPVCVDKYFLYSRVWVFPSYDGTIAEQDYPLFSSMILFNIALVHHIRALEGSNEQALRDALFFYTVSLRIQASVQPYLQKRVIAPIKLAALNNLAIIHYEQGEARKAHAILGEARALLSPSVVLVDGGDDKFNQDDFDGITLNAVMMKWTFAAPCA
ncbi:expressed unknown protein [Seminavis robusta]|uniref:Uncharacterized protein n=1 Tax=Seminavis robusta TaxID=568900 RepID=A0A9N8EY77_9STRA|nr:expressed unknown protein [Seminavis robusta]|eukprot:Sro1957_g307790.1 n/a (225) ;mRNA; f:4390-5064